MPHPDPLTGADVRAYRDAADLTQLALAGRLLDPPMTDDELPRAQELFANLEKIRRWEAGRYNPSPRIARKLTRLMQQEIDR